MAEYKRCASREKKRETWEEREARRLARNVYDHLAYYIQVQLPETKFVNETMTQQLHAPTRRVLRQTARDKSTTKERENSCRMKGAGHGSITGNRKKTTKKSSKKSPNSHARKKISSGTSSTESEDESKVKKKGVIRSETRSTPSTPSRKPMYSSRPYSGRLTSRQRENLNETLRGSPYTADPIAKDMGKTSTAKIMRMEAERVAANATNIIKTLSLDEVVAIQRYRSPAKSFLRCSSSLSEHPHGMLRSDKALEYAVKHNERESARKYMTEKKRKMKLKEKKKREHQKNQLTSTESYQRKYKAPLAPIAYYESEETSSSSSSSDDFKSPSTTSMSSRSSSSTVRKVEKVPARSSSASSKNNTKQSTIGSGRNKEKSTKSTTRYVEADKSKSGLREDVLSSSSDSSEDDEAGAKRSDTESDNTSHDDVTDAEEYQISHKDQAENLYPEGVSTKSISSSQSSMEGSALLEGNYESASANERSSSDDVTNKIARDFSKNHIDSSSRSSSSSDEDTADKSNADRYNEKLVGLNASKTTSDNRILKKLNGSMSDTSSTSGTSRKTSNSQGAATYNGNISRASDERRGERSSAQSSSSNIHKDISVSEEMQSIRRKNSSNDEVFEIQSRKGSKSMDRSNKSKSYSESDNFDVSSMTSSLRQLIEEAEITVSESSSSSSNEDSSSQQRISVEERIFGSSIPDLKQAHAISNGGRPYLESGGEVIGDSPAKSQFM